MRCWFGESVARRSLAQLAPRYMSSRHLPKWMAPGSFIRNLLDASNVELGTSAQPENSAATACIAHKSLRICERCRLRSRQTKRPSLANIKICGHNPTQWQKQQKSVETCKAGRAGAHPAAEVARFSSLETCLGRVPRGKLIDT